MMALTHGAVSVGLVALAMPLAGEYAGQPLLAAALLGGLAPDVDLLAAHRRTCHYPVGYTLLTGLLAASVFLAPSTGLVLAAVAVGAAALHAWSDVLAGSVEPEPWNPTTERAVYNHALKRWHRPRRYIRYSGAPEDFLLALGGVTIAVFSPATGPTAEASLLLLLSAAGGYTLLRRRLAALPARLEPLLPRRLAGRLPSVRVDETDSGATTLTVRFRP
jgi:hypothetical protein